MNDGIYQATERLGGEVNYSRGGEFRDFTSVTKSNTC